MSERPSKFVRNERIKLRASALNSIAVAAGVAGFVTPLAALSFGSASSSGRILVGTFVAAAAWFVIALILHGVANWLLGDLEE